MGSDNFLSKDIKRGMKILKSGEKPPEVRKRKDD